MTNHTIDQLLEAILEQSIGYEHRVVRKKTFRHTTRMSPRYDHFLSSLRRAYSTVDQKPVWLRFVVVFGIILVVIIGARLLPQSVQNTPPPTNTLIPPPTRTPLPKTNTFVDLIIGEVLFFQNNSLRSIDFPSRLETEVFGIDGDSTQRFSVSPATWSLDGQYVFLFKDASTLLGFDYDEQMLIHSYPLRSPLSPSAQPTVHISPFNDVVVVGVSSGNGNESLQFYDLLSGRDVGFFDNCSPKGLWIRSAGFVAKCRVDDVYAVVLIRIYETSTQMTPLTRDSKTVVHELISDYDDASVLIDRRQGTSHTLSQLDANGTLSVLPISIQKKLPHPSTLLDPKHALAKRIEQETTIVGVTDVSVSSNDQWMTFAAGGKLYIAPVDLHEPPYAFAEGTLARIRPY